MSFCFRQLSRSSYRRFFATVANSAAKPKKTVQWRKVAVVIGATGISVAIGNVIYDYIVLKNLEEIDYAVKAGLRWDPEWDSYELLDDTDMLVQPSIDEAIRQRRKKWEKDNGISRRLVIMARHGSVEIERDSTRLSDAGVTEMGLTADKIASIITKNGGVVRAVAHGESEEATYERSTGMDHSCSSRTSARILSDRLEAEMEATPLLDEGFPEMPVSEFSKPFYELLLKLME